MTWILNVSISISTIVIFFYLGIILIGIVCNGNRKEGRWNLRSYDKEKYYCWLIIICWILFNIWQWMVLKC